jgi:hypothetical protein
MKLKMQEVEIPEINRILVEKHIKVANQLDFECLKEEISEHDSEYRKKEFWKKCWTKSSLLKSLSVVVILFLATFTITRPGYKEAFRTGAFLLFIFVVSSISRNYLRKTAGREWRMSPFSEFSKEYKGSVPYTLFTYSENDDEGFYVPAIELWVLWHEYSNTRFLLACEREDVGGLQYCVDCWEI